MVHLTAGVAALLCTLFTGAAIYINLVEHQRASSRTRTRSELGRDAPAPRALGPPPCGPQRARTHRLGHLPPCSRAYVEGVSSTRHLFHGASPRGEAPRTRPGTAGDWTDALAVEDVHGNAMRVEHPADQFVQRRVVGGELLGRLDLHIAGEALAVVREEPPLNAFRPVLPRVGGGIVLPAVGVHVLSGGHGLVVRGADLREHVGIDAADAATHDRVRELVDE